MESRPEFDLAVALDAWRKRSSEDLSDEQLRELESHLVEGSAALREKGLSEAEAFLIATHRLGRPVELGEEFRRNELFTFTSGHARWLLTGALGYVGLHAVFGIVQRIAGTASLLLTHDTAILGASAIIVVVVSLFVGALLLLDVAKGGPMLAPILNSRFLRSPTRVALIVALLIAANWAASHVASLQLNVFLNSVPSAQVGSFLRTSVLLNQFTAAAAGMLAIAAASLVWTPERHKSIS